MGNLYHVTPRFHSSVVHLAKLCKNTYIFNMCKTRCKSPHGRPLLTDHCQQIRLFSVMFRCQRTFVHVCHRDKKVTSPKLHCQSELPSNASTTNFQRWRGFSTTWSQKVPRGTMLADIMREEKERKEKMAELERKLGSSSTEEIKERIEEEDLTSTLNMKGEFSEMKEEQETEEDDSLMTTDEDKMITEDRPHIPVMLTEVLDFLEPKENQILLDMTFGAGGHTEAILQHCDSCKVLALDRDPVACEIAKNMAAKYGKDRLVPLLGRFSNLTTLLKNQQISPGSLDGVVIDAGCSSMQFDTADRGFALSKDGPLDMRMDGNRISNQPTAADYVNSLDALTLSNVLFKYGEEPRAKKIARTIVDYREKYRPIQTTQELATVVSFAFTHTEANKTKDSLGRRSHVATKTFLALRILVNNELHELYEGLKQIETFVKPGGKLAAISFHSMEDRIVKRFLQGRDVTEKRKSLHQKRLETSQDGEEDESVANKMVWDMQRDLMMARDEEIQMNPRSRSAKLRTAVKL